MINLSADKWSNIVKAACQSIRMLDSYGITLQHLAVHVHMSECEC